MLRITLTVFSLFWASFLLADGHFTNWSDKTLCRLAQDSGSEEYRQAAIGRGLTCVAVNTTTTEPTVKIEYDDRITIFGGLRCIRGHGTQCTEVDSHPRK